MTKSSTQKTLDEKAKGWYQVFKANSNFFRGRLSTFINTFLLSAVLAIVIMVVSLVAISKDPNMENKNKIVLIIVTVIAFLIFVWITNIFVANFLVLMLIKKLDREHDKDQALKTIKYWVVSTFKKYPQKYLELLAEPKVEDFLNKK
ncbi:hypothetical protein [Mycoplasmopsis columbina]|uniref:hypothetical protein n=1 Tax=Mycoplasmopsis columbina TaxID=114881 RepID=UPI0004A740C6|nr:hypothetical protein [Mycoplasmopsis columbina]VEU77188.1 Uncharacterised protein [Mycoplasmopsis columbina]